VLLVLLGCGSRRPQPAAAPTTQPTPARVLPVSRVIELETAGPPPPDTSVSFPAGTPRVIVLRHGPPENIRFAQLSFEAAAFADSGRMVTVSVRVRPGIYGLDIAIDQPVRGGARVDFDYARYFSAPVRARQVYRGDQAYERALAVGRLLPEGQIELLPSTRPELDQIGAAMPGPGSYLVAAPQ